VLLETHTLRMLTQQIAVSKFDGDRATANAARRALRAVEKGDVHALDAAALHVLATVMGDSLILDPSRDEWLEVECDDPRLQDIAQRHVNALQAEAERDAA